MPDTATTRVETNLTPDQFAVRARKSLAATPGTRVFDSSRPPARGDHDLNAGNDLATLHPEPHPAAVLVPVVPRADGLQVLLTLRSAHLATHAGQIAFPGGKMEAGDTDALDTALRETEEEIGVPRSQINALGYLDSYQTGTGFRILPVVALVSPKMQLVLDHAEVAETFEVPLAFLMDPGNHQHRATEWKGVTRYFYAMSWCERYIWGATAGIIRNLQETVFPR